jgi:hypothetical protein
MRSSRLVVALAFGSLALFQIYGCSSSPITTDGGVDATAGASQSTAGHTGGAGAIGTAGHGGAGATGTAGHAGGDGGVSCSDLSSQYQTALATARSCMLNTSGQCTQMVSGDLSPCFSNCQIFVNDATALNPLKAQWLQAGCNEGVFACPAIACAQPRSGDCVAADGGSATCGPGQYGIE